MNTMFFFFVDMAKELYLYSGITDFVAESLIAKIEENKGTELTIRQNTPGGSVFAGWGIIAKMKEHGDVKIKVDGFSASMGSMMLVYASHVEALDVSRIMIHRANMHTSSPEDQAFINNINKDLKLKLASKINHDKFKEITGITLDEVFSPDVPSVDVWLNAKQAKEVGLVNEITKLKVSEITAFHSRFNIAAEMDLNNINTKTTNTIMTLDELRIQHPNVFAQAIEAGTRQERERVESWLQFMDIDMEASTKGIANGDNLSVKTMAEFTRKGMNVQALSNIKADNAAPVVTGEIPLTNPLTSKEKALQQFELEAKAHLNL